MQASTLGQKVSNNKKPKYQKYKTNEKKESSTICEITRVNLVEKKDKKENFLQTINLQDFPELRASRKPNTKFDLDSSKQSNSVKSWSSIALKGNIQLVKQALPVKSDLENIRKDNVNIITGKSGLTNLVPENKESASTKIQFKLVPNKAVDKNVSNKNQDVDSVKKKPAQTKKIHMKKKKSDPVLINFQDILAVNKALRKPKRHFISKNKVQGHRNKELLSGNTLDSSNPKRCRGKQREIKKKKLSKFKTTILKERILKHKMREAAANGYLDNESFNKISETDFKAEIKAYLNKLSEKKVKNLEAGQKKICQKTNVEIMGNERQEKVVCKSEDSNLIKRKQIPEIDSDNIITFSSKFREYCDNIITPELNASVYELIKGVIELQDKLFLRDPIKAKAKKRHVTGIREVRKYLNLKKVKLLVIAPNLEKLHMEGSVYDSIEELKLMAVAQNVSYVFALDRYKLGKYTKKNVPVSAFAILNYEGLEGLYENVVHQLLEAKKRFSELSSSQTVEKNTKNDVNSKFLSLLVSAIHERLKISSED